MNENIEHRNGIRRLLINEFTETFHRKLIAIIVLIVGSLILGTVAINLWDSSFVPSLVFGLLSVGYLIYGIKGILKLRKFYQNTKSLLDILNLTNS